MLFTTPVVKRLGMLAILGIFISVCSGCIVRVPGGYGYTGHHHHYHHDDYIHGEYYYRR